MKYRKLRIAWSVGCGIVCLLMIALWGRSIVWQDDVGYAFENTREACLTSISGTLHLTWGYNAFGDSELGEWFFTSRDLKETHGEEGYEPAQMWHFDVNQNYTYIEFPHWFVVLFTSGMAVLPWLRRRFSLRALLIGMTVVAVAIGAVVLASR